MAGLDQHAVERLRAYLQELNPGARSLLIAELERGVLRGDEMAGAELILSELRRGIRQSQSTSQRIGHHARLFFAPLEPFIVDDVPDHKHRGRIARSAIEPIWLWISANVMPDEADSFAAQVEAALQSGDADKAQHLARVFQDDALSKLEELLAAAASNDKAMRRVNAQLGTPRALDDAKTLVGILKHRDAVAMLGAQLPGHIKTLAGGSLESVKAQLDSRLNSHPDMFVYTLVLVMSRLAAPWHLIRLATRAAGSDIAARIEETPYGVAVHMVLTEVARMVSELCADLKSGRVVAVTALLRDVHDALRGLRSELDLSGDSAWARQLTAIRADISKLVSNEINLMPGRVRRLMRPRPAKEIAPGSTIDADEVAEAEALVGFVMACRNYASELAINEITQRTFTELQQCLDSGTKLLLETLRTAGDKDRTFRQSQVDAAVRFCAKVFGQDYALLLTKAADIASHTDRKAAARA
jgi:HPt (histidine-containing phosphotransfer) domain-containing protein